MSNLAGAVTLENEIVKATDFQYAHDQQYKNIALVLKTIVSGSGHNFILGGSVAPYTNGGMNVQVDGLLAYCDANKEVGIETEMTKPVSVEAADDTLDRKDIVQVAISEVGFDEQSRAFIDPDTKVKTFEHINTKKKVVLTISVKKGSNGSEIAPAVDEGCVKIAEISVPAGTLNITSDLIENVSSRVAGGENVNWTADKDSTFAPIYLASLIRSYLTQHNEDGTHKNNSIVAAMLKFGTESGSINASLLPVGESMTLNKVSHESVESTKELIKAIVTFCNGVYAYTNNIFSRYEYLEDVPAAVSTENIDVTEGGETTIDGVSVTAGQIVFLKDQTDKKENGLWEVQTGSWNRADDYEESTTAFDHKLVFAAAGTVNKGKVFFLPGNTYIIGTDELDFTEANFTSDKQAHKFVMRDENGRAKMAEPEEDDDIATKHYTDSQVAALDTTIGRGVRNIWFPRKRWLRFDFSDSSHKSVKIDKGVYIPLDSSRVFYADTEKHIDLSEYLTLAGKDYYIYLVPNGEGTKFVASINSSAPSDVSENYTTENTRRIGQLHTECVAIPADTTMRHKDSTAITDIQPMLLIPYTDEDSDFKEFYTKTPTNITTGTNFNTFTVPHPLAGWSAGDIIPESIFCIGFMPLSSADGMFYVKELDVAIDIYLQSGRGSLTKSVYGGATTRSRAQVNHTDDMLAVGKQLLSDAEFTLGAMGSNEQTSISGAAESSITTAGGHVDSAGRRMVSARGGEDFCGGVWQWLRDVSANGGSDWSDYAGGVKFGQTYGSSYALLAGGAWNSSSNCGSRSRGGDYSRAIVYANFGGRGSSRIKA